MNFANLFIEDRARDALVADLARILAIVEGNPLDNPAEHVANTGTDAVFEQTLTKLPILFMLKGRELERAFNVFFAILSKCSPDAQASGIKRMVTHVAETDPSKGSEKIRILIMLFNHLDASNPLRFDVLMGIIKGAVKFDEVDRLADHLARVDDWLTASSCCSDDSKREIFLQLTKALETAAPDASMKYMTKYLNSFADSAAVSKEILNEACCLALKLSSFFAFEDMLDQPSIQRLKGTPGFELMHVYVEGDFADYVSLLKKNASFLAQNGLNEETLTKKMRIMTLAALAAKSLGKRVSYADLAKSLSVEVADVESWLIESMRCGVVEGKMNQQTQSFTASRAYIRKFDLTQWQSADAKLNEWKQALSNFKGIMQETQQAVQAEVMPENVTSVGH